MLIEYVGEHMAEGCRGPDWLLASRTVCTTQGASITQTCSVSFGRLQNFGCSLA